MKKINDYPKIELTQKNIIALKCGECCGFDWNMVNECSDFLCALWTARPKGRKDNLKTQFWDEEKLEMMARPVVKKNTKILSDEQRLAAGERLRKIRKEKKSETSKR